MNYYKASNGQLFRTELDRLPECVVERLAASVDIECARANLLSARSNVLLVTCVDVGHYRTYTVHLPIHFGDLPGRDFTLAKVGLERLPEAEKMSFECNDALGAEIDRRMRDDLEQRRRAEIGLGVPADVIEAALKVGKYFAKLGSSTDAVWVLGPVCSRDCETKLHAANAKVKAVQAERDAAVKREAEVRESWRSEREQRAADVARLQGEVDALKVLFVERCYRASFGRHRSD